MTASFKYWDDCVDPSDLEALWADSQVRTEWLDAGETSGHKVHLSRDPDGQPFLTQTEMRAVVEIIVHRHFDSHVDPDMICAIAELESDRQPLLTQYNKKTKETTFGIMQISEKTADWLIKELGYQAYEQVEDRTLLYKPFINLYLGAAYLKWLSNYEQVPRGEEFVVRAFKGTVKKVNHKSTLPYWRRYLSVKESLPSRKIFKEGPSMHQGGSGFGQNAEDQAAGFTAPSTSPTDGGVNSKKEGSDAALTYWESKTSPEDMQEMWSNREVHREWVKCRKKRGHVWFSQDENKRPYVSQIELKGVAQIILSKHFSTRGVKPTILCAIAESISMRFVNGIGSRIGLMGIDYGTADWLYKELGYKAYRVESAEDLTKPFVSMYFGAAYLAWLSQYEGRERSPKFVIQAYFSGPKNVNLDETGPGWLKFEEALSRYEDIGRDSGSCSIL